MDNIIQLTIIGVVAVGAGITAALFFVMDEKTPEIVNPEESNLAESVGISEPIIESADISEFGEYGSDHAHAQIFVVLFGYTVDFSAEQYQLSSPLIHFEDHEGSWIHRHATGATLRFFFESIGMQLTQNCFVYDDGTYCTDSKNNLEFYVNGIPVDRLDDYVVQDGDRVIISYGNDSLSIIDDTLDSI